MGGWGCGGAEIKFKGWKWSSKNNKRHQKKSRGLKKFTKQQNNKSKNNYSLLWSINATTNIQRCIFFALFLSAHTEPSNMSKHGVYIYFSVYFVGSYDWHRRYHYWKTQAAGSQVWTNSASEPLWLWTSFTFRWYDMVQQDEKYKYSNNTFLWVGSVIFKLHMAVCGRPLLVLGSLRKERRPHGSWPTSLTCRQLKRRKEDCHLNLQTFTINLRNYLYLNQDG